MFINKTPEGYNNLCGGNLAKIRIGMKLSQRQLADQMQIHGIDMDKNAIQRIEARKRFVTDIELIVFSEVLHVTIEELLKS